MITTNEKFTLTGGARIGRANASFPFAELTVDKEILKINASIIGSLIFQAKDIISIQPHTAFPVIGNGIKIKHSVENYQSEVIFWTFKNPSVVINEIEKTGFLQNNDSQISHADLEITRKQNEGGFPIRKSVGIIFVVVWNLFFLFDIITFFLQGKTEGTPLGIGVSIALGLLFVSSILTLLSDKFRSIILKENKHFDDIKKFTYLAAFISGISFIALTSSNLIH